MLHNFNEATVREKSSRDPLKKTFKKAPKRKSTRQQRNNNQMLLKTSLITGNTNKERVPYKYMQCITNLPPVQN